MTAAIWTLAIGVLCLVAAIIWIGWTYLYGGGQSHLDVLSDAEVADRQAPYGQGVMGAPAQPPLNGTPNSYEDVT